MAPAKTVTKAKTSKAPGKNTAASKNTPVVPPTTSSADRQAGTAIHDSRVSLGQTNSSIETYTSITIESPKKASTKRASVATKGKNAVRQSTAEKEKEVQPSQGTQGTLASDVPPPNPVQDGDVIRSVSNDEHNKALEGILHRVNQERNVAKETNRKLEDRIKAQESTIDDLKTQIQLLLNASQQRPALLPSPFEAATPQPPAANSSTANPDKPPNSPHQDRNTNTVEVEAPQLASDGLDDIELRRKREKTLEGRLARIEEKKKGIRPCIRYLSETMLTLRRNTRILREGQTDNPRSNQAVATKSA